MNKYHQYKSEHGKSVPRWFKTGAAVLGLAVGVGMGESAPGKEKAWAGKNYRLVLQKKGVMPQDNTEKEFTFFVEDLDKGETATLVFTDKGKKIREAGSVRDLKDLRVASSSAFAFMIGAFRGDYIFREAKFYISKGAEDQSLSIASSEMVVFPMGNKFLAANIALENVPSINILSHVKCDIISISKCKECIVGNGGSLVCDSAFIFESKFENRSRFQYGSVFPILSVLSDKTAMCLNLPEKTKHLSVLLGFIVPSEFGYLVDDDQEAYWSSFSGSVELPFCESKDVPLLDSEQYNVPCYDVKAFEDCSFLFVCRLRDGFSSDHSRKICFSVKDQTGAILGKSALEVTLGNYWTEVVCLLKADTKRAKGISFSYSKNTDNHWGSYPIRFDLRKYVPRVFIFDNKK